MLQSGSKAHESPVKTQMGIPYGRQSIDDSDIRAVVEALQSAWLTTGPQLEAFEHAVAACTGTAHAVAVSNGTAALHAAMQAVGIEPGDEVIVSPMTFVGTANAVVMQGGLPVFADVERDTLLISPAAVEACVTPRTKAIIAVDYAGQPCDYVALRRIAARHGIALVADACHSLGGSDHGQPVGSLADLTVFSFHPVKAMTTGEGGMIVTNDAQLATRMRRFRNHGITTDHRQRAEKGTWYYEMIDLGWNYRLSDIQAALGLSQVRKLPGWIARRQAIAARYDDAFRGLDTARPLSCRPDVSHAYHLYVLRLDRKSCPSSRGEIFTSLRRLGIDVQVHYIPVYLHPYYQSRFGFRPGLCPVTEEAYENILSLPMFPALTEQQIQHVITSVQQTLGAFDAVPALSGGTRIATP